MRRFPGSQGHPPVGHGSERRGGRSRQSCWAAARGTLTRKKEVPPQLNIAGQPPRVGVFVCHCGINIGGVVDVQAVRDYAKTLPYVEYVANNLYTCSQDTQVTMQGRHPASTT